MLRSRLQPEADGEAHRLDRIVEHVAHVLPAQGPLSVFIHHNTLHAFEELPFEQAVVAAARTLGRKAFLPEEQYREELSCGRITEADVATVLNDDLGARGRELVGGVATRFELRRRLALHGIPEARGAPLDWILEETAVLSRARPLWQSCLDAVERSDWQPVAPAIVRVRPRDRLLAAGGPDLDEWIDPVLIRFVAAYLDQGLAHWPMPDRELGMHRCFLETYGRPLARLCGPWARGLPALIAADRAAGRDGRDSLHASLLDLAVPEDGWQDLLTEEALALRGWAGMVRQIEERPDRVPAYAVPARLVDFLAVRLLLTRAALAHAAPRASAPPAVRVSPPSVAERAWPIFHAAQLCGLDASAVDALPATAVSALERELAAFGPIERRRILHLAYERWLRHRFYDALAQHTPAPPPSSPPFQAIFCLDEREESFRRHLEEVAPDVETFGTAGFFGVAMYYRGTTDAHPRPLCPVTIQPEHYVAETRAERRRVLERLQDLRTRAGGLVDKNIHIGSRTLFRGAVLMATVGVLWVVPLVLRVLFPWLRQRLARLDTALAARTTTSLRLDREDVPPPIGRHSGFTPDEMAGIVQQQLATSGIGGRFAPLVFVLGHGSTSLNNPHESAHDCGACGGGRGGPNARAFARMANDPRVRTLLAGSGVDIPAGTWFVGGQRDTASNAVVFFDADLVPAALRTGLERAKEAFERARTTEAHERARRFDAVPGALPARLALFHVQARSADLAQVRPEYGHATNAFCVVGRRTRTRGLFLDRRAFLVSYDPTADPDGAALARLLAAVVPVIAGISLEYWFGTVDPTGYGSGTKLPHNVACLLGVMDGAQSDLRTGLPWQMLEIHEPVRLALVVETTPDVLARILRDDAALRRLVDHRWIFLGRLDPDASDLFEVDGSGSRRYEPERPLPSFAGGSMPFYRGRRGHLPFVRLEPVA